MLDTLTYVLFESPIALGVPLALLLFVLLVRWRRSGNARPLLIGLAAAVVLLTAQALIVTQREIAGAALGAIERDLEHGRLDALERRLAPDFRTQGRDRAAFLELGRRRLESLRIVWVQRTGLTIAEDRGERFAARASYLASVAIEDVRVTTQSSWSVVFERQQGRWLIVAIEPRTVDNQDVRTWEEIGR